MLTEIRNLIDELKNLLGDVAAKIEAALAANVENAAASSEVKLGQETIDAIAQAVEQLLSTPKQ